jgi:hypothetical protein
MTDCCADSMQDQHQVNRRPRSHVGTLRRACCAHAYTQSRMGSCRTYLQ